MDAARIADWLKRTGRALPWPDLGVAAGVVVVGVSQIFFSLLGENADYFPEEPWFHLGVIAWIAALPFAIVLAADLGVTRWAGRGRVFSVWRALLYTFLFASMLRQTQIYYPAPFQWIVERIPPRPPMYGLLALVFLLCLRSKALIHRYAAAFGILAVMLAGSYAYRAGLMGEAWRGPKGVSAGSPVEWKNDPVIICVFDELSNDALLKDGRVDAERYPNFAALAAEAACFTNARTNHMFTKDAFPCMLTGRLLPPKGTPTLFDYLPRKCGVIARDYFPPTYGWMRRNARDGQTFLLCGYKEEPLQNFLGIPRALFELFRETPFSRPPFAVNPGRRLMPPLMRGKPPAERSVQVEIEGFLSSVNAGEAAGSLVFWHCQIPHFPFKFNPDGSQHDDEANIEFLGPGSNLGRPVPAGYSNERTMENYRKQIGYADHVLGRLITMLKRQGLYDRTTLVVTSDHGLRTWGATPQEKWPNEFPASVTRVPLMIRGPKVKPGAVPVEYFHMDFTPTLLDALGIPFDPAAFEGVSAFAPTRPVRVPIMFNSHLKKLDYDPARDMLRLANPD